MPLHQPPEKGCNSAVSLLLAAQEPVQQAIIGRWCRTPWPAPIVAKAGWDPNRRMTRANIVRVG